MLTRPKLIAPFHIGLGGNLSSSEVSREKMAFLVYSDKSIARRVAWLSEGFFEEDDGDCRG